MCFVAGSPGARLRPPARTVRGATLDRHPLDRHLTIYRLPVRTTHPALDHIQAAVLGWYAAKGRDLAFRRTRDPWAILVSEVIAQQTQAARAAEAWERFIEAFPTPAALAAVSPATVIRAWRGLGYNRRAIALRAAAIRIVEDHGGLVPDTLDALSALPGVGPYTARAVLAFAFDQPVAPLDTNIRRVLDRAIGPLPVAPKALQSTADGFVPRDAASDWAHALMDLGATICTARAPRCNACPIRAWCRSPQAGAVAMADGLVRGRRHAHEARPFRPRAGGSAAESSTACAILRTTRGSCSTTPSAPTLAARYSRRSAGCLTRACSSRARRVSTPVS